MRDFVDEDVEEGVVVFCCLDVLMFADLRDSLVSRSCCEF